MFSNWMVHCDCTVNFSLLNKHGISDGFELSDGIQDACEVTIKSSQTRKHVDEMV